MIPLFIPNEVRGREYTEIPIGATFQITVRKCMDDLIYERDEQTIAPL